jgi:tetratricopeptide (TPR) repeat protein
MSGQLENAIHAADDALRLRPGDANALGVKALALFDHGDHAQAMQAARQALSQDADQHEALLAAASINLAQQEFADARALLERGLHRHPQSGRALSAYGQVLMAADELPAATDVLAQATLAMPGHIGTWHALAWSQLLQGHVQRAEASYRAAYEIDRNFGDTHGGLALIDALAGRLDEAEAGVRRALRLDPNAVTARYAQAIIRREQGDDAQADALMAALVPEDALRRGMTPAEFGQRLRNIIASGQR